jgi:hypothetical protein
VKHRAEGIFVKWNRIVGGLLEQKGKCEVSLGGIDMTNAMALSHLLNVEFGINEKAPDLGDWLSAICALAANAPLVT